MRIIISRTDSIGDVVLTLPMAGILKNSFPGCTIIFLGREYTRPVVELCRYVDEFVSWGPPPRPSAGGNMPPPQPSPDEDIPPPRPSPKKGREEEEIKLLRDLKADVIIHVFPVKKICRAAWRAGIPMRIATAGRFYTLFTCNKLLHIPRKNSGLHEAQLNLKLLKPLGVDRAFGLEEIWGMYGLESGQGDGQKNYEYRISNIEYRIEGNIPGSGEKDNERFTLILHPKSKGSAREWGLENFSKLIDLLPAEKFDIIISGTKEEGALMTGFLEKHRGRVKDLTGKLSLSEFIALIGASDGLVAASTGPLHIAAALGTRAIGLYAPMRPIFPQRWAPLGKNAIYLVLDKTCNDCRKTMDCRCIRSITPESVVEKIRK
jgi:heptosyltransferase III